MTLNDDKMVTIGVLDMNADIKEPTTLVGVKLESQDVGISVEGYGLARCKPGDHFDVNVGIDIATGRALQELGKQLEQQGLDASITESQHEWTEGFHKFADTVADSLRAILSVYPRG